MADTIITTPSNSGDSGGNVVMGVVLAIIIAAIAIGALFMYQNGVFQTESPKTETTNINVTAPPVIPTPTPAE